MKVKKKIAPLYPISSTPVSAQVKPLLSDQEKRFLEILADSIVKQLKTGKA